MGEISELGAKAIADLGLSPPVESALKNIQAELADAYREGFLHLTETINKMASTLARIQSTLSIVVEHLDPKLVGKIPVGLQVAHDGEADIAKAFVIADPIGMGFTLSQKDLSAALGLAQPTVSVLVRALGLNDDPDCAVTVRRGSEVRGMVNYHPSAVTRFRELIANPPKALAPSHARSVSRVRAMLAAQPR